MKTGARGTEAGGEEHGSRKKDATLFAALGQRTLGLLYLAVVSLPFESLWSGISDPSYVVRGMPPFLWIALVACSPGIVALFWIEIRQREQAQPAWPGDYLVLIAIVAIFTSASGALVLSTIAAVVGVAMWRRGAPDGEGAQERGRPLGFLLGVLIALMAFNWGLFFVRHHYQGNLWRGFERPQDSSAPR